MVGEELEEGIVAGDGGGDAGNIASGELSGNFVVASKAIKYAKETEKKDKKNRKKKKVDD